MPVEERELHSNALSEDTLSVLRNGGNNGNEIEKKAAGIDKVTKAEYEEHLEENITNLVERWFICFRYSKIWMQPQRWRITIDIRIH